MTRVKLAPAPDPTAVSPVRPPICMSPISPSVCKSVPMVTLRVSESPLIGSRESRNSIFFYITTFTLFFVDMKNRTCVPCEPNCASCQDRPEYCTSCDHHLVMHENKCYSACPLDTYETEENKCVEFNKKFHANR